MVGAGYHTVGQGGGFNDFYDGDLFNSALDRAAIPKKYFGETVKRLASPACQGWPSAILRAKLAEPALVQAHTATPLPSPLETTVSGGCRPVEGLLYC